MSHPWIIHVTYVDESCHTYEGVESTWSHVSWHELRVMSHIWLSHVTHVNESCHTCERVMSNIWMSLDCESCRTHEWFVSPISIMHALAKFVNEYENCESCHTSINTSWERGLADYTCMNLGCRLPHGNPPQPHTHTTTHTPTLTTHTHTKKPVH